MHAPSKAVEHLESRMARLSALHEAHGMLHWDLASIMPEGGFEARAEQLATLETVTHEMLTGDEMGDALAAAQRDLDPHRHSVWQQVNIAEIAQRRTRALAVDSALVEALSRAATRTQSVWQVAKAEADYKRVLPDFEVLLTLVRERAVALSTALGISAYDALLDEFEPGLRDADITPLFDDLAVFLPDFTDEVLAQQGQQPAPRMPQGTFPVDAQRALGIRLMECLGFDFKYGRLDTSAHPFCGGVPDDVRITTRYDTDDFTTALMGVLHETGHALYERGLPVSWRRQPVGEALGMSIHESQSLLVEMQLCRSRAFLTFAAPMMRDAFQGEGEEWGTENLYALYTRVTRDFLRVHADEVTYPAHVILRTRLEKALLSGDLLPHELPHEWNVGMQDLLGIVPPDDAKGCLQDVHWFDGAFGYFPTYTLGAMTAAQLYHTAKKSIHGLDRHIEKGHFSPLMTWLRDAIHAKGRLLSARDLLIEVTGKPLDNGIFKDHLTERYLESH